LIFSGVVAATSSMSMPPAALTMNTAFLVARSTMMPDVRLGADVGGLGDEHLLDGQPLDVHAEDRLRLLARRLGRRAVLHAARLAAAADVDLRLHHDGLADARAICLRLVGRRRHLAGRDRHAVAAKHVLRLVLVNVH
jgi:hypothetical protein